MFKCNSNCWFCYLSKLPENIVDRLFCDAVYDFDNFVRTNIEGSFGSEIEVASIKIKGVVYGDVTSAPIEEMCMILNKVKDRGLDIWVERILTL